MLGGDWQHDLVLRMAEFGQVGHAAHVLSHRQSPALMQAGPGAVEQALSRRDDQALVEPGPGSATWRVRRQLPTLIPVTVIVPFRDAPSLLRTCVDTVTATVEDWPLQWLLIDNGSTEPETATLLERLDGRDNVTVVTDSRPLKLGGPEQHGRRPRRG